MYHSKSSRGNCRPRTTQSLRAELEAQERRQEQGIQELHGMPYCCLDSSCAHVTAVPVLLEEVFQDEVLANLKKQSALSLPYACTLLLTAI